MQTLIKTAVFGCALLLGACEGGKDPAPKPNKEAAKKTPAADSAGPDGIGGEDDEQVAAPSLDPKVEQAVTVANQISAKPEAADSILEEAGMDREAFERLLYEIARDPELSKSYAVAREA